MVNKVILVGRLGADPEVRYMQDGTMVTNFRLATDEQWKDKSGEKVQRTEWHRVVAFRKLAEICGNFLSKGRLVYVEGKCRRDPGKTRMDRNDSRRRSSRPTCRCSSRKAAAGKKTASRQRGAPLRRRRAGPRRGCAVLKKARPGLKSKGKKARSL